MSEGCPPVVLHIPHASAIIPDEIRATLVLSGPELEDELRVMTDWYTEELFAVDASLARTIVFPMSRLVVDPERFVDDELEEMAKVGMGVVYTRTSLGESLRQGLTAEDKAALIEKYYEPHHRRLASAVAEALAAHGRCLIVDGHSFPTLALPYELDQRPNRPDVCIGTDDFHTPPQLLDLAVQAVKEEELRVEVNRPFSGTLVPLEHYGKNPDVQSIMIEIRRGLYMDEVTGEKLSEFEGVREGIGRALKTIADHLRRATS